MRMLGNGRETTSACLYRVASAFVMSIAFSAPGSGTGVARVDSVLGLTAPTSPLIIGASGATATDG